MTTAFLFPGQGSQSIGMGKEFAANFSSAKKVFDEIDEALNQNLSQLMWEGSNDDLTLTSNTQPALMAVSMAMLGVMKDEFGIAAQKNAQFLAGHSLGEYTALCAAGAFDISQTAKLLRIRGDAMQEAVPVGEGAMAAILGLELSAVERLFTELGTGHICEIANDNAPGQIVVSGSKQGVELVCEAAKTAGAKRALLLPVSAPFHSSLMQPAAEKMQNALAQADISEAKTPIIANIDMQITTLPDDIRQKLVRQVTGRVQWTKSITALSVDHNVDKFIEIGAGKVLSGLVKRILKEAGREAKIITINTIEDMKQLEAVLEA